MDKISLPNGITIECFRSEELLAPGTGSRFNTSKSNITDVKAEVVNKGPASYTPKETPKITGKVNKVKVPKFLQTKAGKLSKGKVGLTAAAVAATTIGAVKGAKHIAKKNAEKKSLAAISKEGIDIKAVPGVIKGVYTGKFGKDIQKKAIGGTTAAVVGTGAVLTTKGLMAIDNRKFYNEHKNKESLNIVPNDEWELQ